MLWVKIMKTMMSAISIMESIRRTFTDSFSVQKIIGTGPMTTTPPPFASAFVFVERKANKIAAMKVIANPMMMSTNPNVLIEVQSNNLLLEINTKE